MYVLYTFKSASPACYLNTDICIKVSEGSHHVMESCIALRKSLTFNVMKKKIVLIPRETYLYYGSRGIKLNIEWGLSPAYLLLKQFNLFKYLLVLHCSPMCRSPRHVPLNLLAFVCSAVSIPFKVSIGVLIHTFEFMQADNFGAMIA